MQTENEQSEVPSADHIGDALVALTEARDARRAWYEAKAQRQALEFHNEFDTETERRRQSEKYAVATDIEFAAQLRLNDAVARLRIFTQEAAELEAAAA